ncbi:MAG: hypothetical protein M1546_07685 [Chloroflexi bacterium]|nr:hypothetical protein [Chloroflexota bacterium]
MRFGRISSQWLPVTISIAMLLIPLWLALSLWNEIYQNPLVAELDAAQHRWSSRTFDRYRMIVDREQLRRRCLQDVEVVGEQVITVFQDSCYSKPLSVSDLFGLLRQNMALTECNDDTCKCRITYRVSVIYDENLGYPSMSLFAPNRFRSELVETDILGMALPIGRRVECPPITPVGYETISIRKFTPLP